MAHPKVKVKELKSEKVLNWISILTIISICVYTIFIFPKLPDTIAIHFNSAGEADEWGSKYSIIFLPILIALLFAGMYILSRFPHVFNYPIKITEENAPRVYPVVRLLVAIINFEIVILFSILQVEMVQVAITGVSHISALYAILFIFIPLVTCIVFFIKIGKLE